MSSVTVILRSYEHPSISDGQKLRVNDHGISCIAKGIHNIGSFLIMCLSIRIVHSFGDFKQMKWHSQAALKALFYGLAIIMLAPTWCLQLWKVV